MARVIETAEHIMALAFALACNVVTLRSRNFVNPRSHTSPHIEGENDDGTKNDDLLPMWLNHLVQPSLHCLFPL